MKPAKLESDNGQPLNVLLGIYRNRILAETLRFGNLKEANAIGRGLEHTGCQFIIRCGVSKLPNEYPYAE